MHGLGSKFQKLGLGLVVFALVAGIGAAVWLSGQAQTEEDAAAAGQPESISQALTGDTNLAIPAFEASAGSEVNAVSRLVDLDTIIPTRPRTDVITYTVEAGDNLFMIAERFGLQPETLLWGNYETLRDNPQFLKVGQVLNVLPVDGVYYQVPEGQDLGYIANFFKVDQEAIISYRGNHLKDDLTDPNPPELAAGTWLIVPGGRRELKDWGPPAITRANPAAAAYYGSGYCGTVYEGAIGIGTFIWPTVAKTLSGYDYRPPLHNGIDIAGAEGNAIFAVDSGVVVFSGWSEYGYGYLVVLDHGTGWQSAYAHLSSVNVQCGESVAQGQVIGGLGTTGNSTGPHLHFELRSEIYGKVNPWDWLSY